MILSELILIVSKLILGSSEHDLPVDDVLLITDELVPELSVCRFELIGLTAKYLTCRLSSKFRLERIARLLR